VPACGFSIGFERVVDLIELPDDEEADAVVLVFDPTVALSRLLTLKTDLVSAGRRVRLERRTKNLKALLDRSAASGFASFAFVTDDTDGVASLEFKPLA
jgi:histidyl-tRNA synthetase